MVLFGCLAQVLGFLNDAAVVAAIVFHDPARGVNSAPASMLDLLDKLLTHGFWSSRQLLRVYLARFNSLNVWMW